MPAPPADSSCYDGLDHHIGWAAGGCRGCGRVVAACKARPCRFRSLPPGRRALRAAGRGLGHLVPRFVPGILARRIGLDPRGGTPGDGEGTAVVLRHEPGAPG